MTSEVFFLSCFATGLVLSLLSVVSGLGHLHVGHWHFGHAHGSHAAHGRGSISPINAFTLLAFVCWFGGVGYLLVRSHLFGLEITVALAALAGLTGAAVVFGFLVKVLLPHERELLPEDTEMRGVVGRVSAPLRPGRTGEILFSMNGARRCAPARLEAGDAVDRHGQVLVVRYERGVAYVRPFRELEELEAPDMPT